MSDSSASSPAPARPLEQNIFDEWPANVRALFDGSSLADKPGFTASLLTVDANGHVRTSLLSLGELYAPDSRTLCIALWPQARATRAIAQNGRAALSFVCDEAFYQVQLRVVPMPSAAGDDSGLVYLLASIDAGESQSVRYARLTGGITFELQGEGSKVLERWEQQLERLKQAAAAQSR
ncbi:pyridoxamine 5'-phosphate oxidase family protein [Paraburkholderia sp. ZP32-5]|uniref:pyridoxamine 5'-phosphate oxidase family protein n=1 Tax=Paraburkholderia sp. ZP32-5 TaxID=2883245 RepID=UPI001F187F17|nr:pyridoxamine 5'-phosphate oxidase family protein [Paraburkholderia sp. ZP32-5]